ncbi:MAG: pyridoxal-phosphate dependent enzyme [Ferruginibacter sp.]
MLIDLKNIQSDELENIAFTEKNIKVFVARLDLLHPVVSGNKIFKLQYFLEAGMQAQHKTLLSFGGAFSNHLLATAFASKANGLKSIGIVRGEKPGNLSLTLQQCQDFGMQLHFISRQEFKNAGDESYVNRLKAKFGNCIVIPEGGYHPLGARGASLILGLLKNKEATHICTATGTATTLAGLLLSAGENQQVIAVPVIKNMTDIEDRVYQLTHVIKHKNLQIIDGYHFGGYAKKNRELVNFMNEFYIQYCIPTDFVYTAKLMFAVQDKINAGFFPPGSRIICLHTGGLQGNHSLPRGTLIF